jgi:hypothetical protein
MWNLQMTPASIYMVISGDVHQLEMDENLDTVFGLNNLVHCKAG